MSFLKRARAFNQTGNRLRKKEEDIYNAIKDQPDLVPVSKKLATRSIVFSVLSILTVIIALVGAYFLLSPAMAENFLTSLLILIVGGAILVYLFAIFVIKAIVCLIYQFRLNKKAHTWVALAFLILPVIVLIIGIIIIIGASVNA